MIYLIALFTVLIVLIAYYLYHNGIIQINLDSNTKTRQKDVMKTSPEAKEEIEVEDTKDPDLTIEGKVPPSAKMFGKKSPATCDFDNSAVMRSRMQPEDRTFDYRMAKRMKMTQQNQYRQQYAQARNNADKFRWIWKAELDEQERRQWMNQPSGAIRLSKYDDY